VLQELCTLLKACHNSAAATGSFLGPLFKVLLLHPRLVEGWSRAEQEELHM
jgi:hypothetical protein